MTNEEKQKMIDEAMKSKQSNMMTLEEIKDKLHSEGFQSVEQVFDLSFKCQSKHVKNQLDEHIRHAKRILKEIGQIPENYKCCHTEIEIDEDLIFVKIIMVKGEWKKL